jgi:predicted DNA-binding transcriptional regulator AlpA
MATYLRFPDLKSRGIVSNWVTLRRWIETQGFPSGVKLGPNTRAWDEGSIESWLAQRPHASSDTKAA